MDNILGTVITAMVTDKNEDNVFAQKEGVTFKVVDVSPETFDIGDMVEGFAYTNQKDQYVLMTQIPSVHSEAYDWGEVVAVQRDLGVFVDVGWIDKDLVVSLDDLPILTNLWPRRGDRLYLSMRVDAQERLWGQLATQNEFLAVFKEGTKEMHNEDIGGTVISALKAGSYVSLDDGYMGFIHPNERDEEPRLGQRVDGRIVGLRDDGVLYVSLMPRAHEVLDEDASMLFELLKRSEDGRIPYHDKSDPDAIRTYFGISKGQFKRAVGRLMKANIVKQDKEGTYLTDEGKERGLE